MTDPTLSVDIIEDTDGFWFVMGEKPAIGPYKTQEDAETGVVRFITDTITNAVAQGLGGKVLK